MEKLRTYWESSLRIARVHAQSPLRVMLKVLVAKTRHKVGIGHFKLYQFAAQPMSAYGDYLPQRELEQLLFPLGNDDDKALTQDKVRFYLRCVEAGLPTPPVVARLSLAPDAADDPAIPLARDGASLLPLLEAAGGDSFIFKPLGGGHGEGVERLGFRDGGLRDDSDRPVDAQALVERLLSTERPGFEFATDEYIVQPTLRPHEGLRAITTSDVLGTFRVITFLRGDAAEVGYVVLKIPTQAGVTDNFAAGASSTFVAEVDPRSGQIVRCGGASQDHPDILENKTRVPGAATPLDGFQVPDFAQVQELAKAAARAFPHPASNGWDIALTDAGPSLIEGNWRYGISVLQAALLRGLAPELTGKLAGLERRTAARRGE